MDPHHLSCQHSALSLSHSSTRLLSSSQVCSTRDRRLLTHAQYRFRITFESITSLPLLLWECLVETTPNPHHKGSVRCPCGFPFPVSPVSPGPLLLLSILVTSVLGCLTQYLHSVFCPNAPYPFSAKPCFFNLPGASRKVPLLHSHYRSGPTFFLEPPSYYFSWILYINFALWCNFNSILIINFTAKIDRLL